MYSNIIKRNDGSIKMDTGCGPLEMIANKDGRVEIIIESKRVAITSIDMLCRFIKAFDSSSNLSETERVINNHSRKLDVMVLEKIKPGFRESFYRFIDTGEADEAFLKYMNEDEGCQQTVDAALNRQADGIRAFAESLRCRR